MDSQRYESRKCSEERNLSFNNEDDFDYEDLDEGTKRYILDNPSGLEMYRFSCYFRKLQRPSIEIKEEYGGIRGLYVNIPFVELIFGLNKYDNGFSIFNLIIV